MGLRGPGVECLILSVVRQDELATTGKAMLAVAGWAQLSFVVDASELSPYGAGTGPAAAAAMLR